jgi:hypothetical protein
MSGKVLRKRSVLVVALMATWALAIPSIASAASWGVIGTTHNLDASNLVLNVDSVIGTIPASCAASTLHAVVSSAAALTITSATFPQPCQGATGAAVGCTVTVQPTRLPWIITGTTTSNVTLEGLHLDLRYETRPPAGSVACALNGISITATGKLHGGAWDAAAHQITYVNAPGSIGHSPLGPGSGTFTATFRDTAQTLTLT